MIVPMKKIHVVVLKSRIVSALEVLRDLGSVHVEHQETLSGYQLEERREEVGILNQSIAVLKAVESKKDINQKQISDWTEVVNAILKWSARIEHYKEKILKRKALISQWEAWGDFNPKDIQALQEKGIYVKLCLVPVSQKGEAPKGVVLSEIAVTGSIARCVAVSNEEFELPFDTVELPKRSLQEMFNSQDSEQEKIEEFQKNILAYKCYENALNHILIEREDVLQFEEVEAGMREDEQLAVLKGFAPEDRCSAIQKKAKEEHWGLLVEDPSKEDQVPTLLKNSKFVNLSKPAFDVIEIMPGYTERDVSAVFIIFFTLFFAMLIGDAAYGAIFALATFFIQRKLGKKVKDKTPFHLVYLLTGFTVLWGVLTGTYFGQEWLPSVIKPVFPWLNEASNIQWMCFTVALCHLSVARVWAVKVKFPNMTFISEIGWLLIVWGMYFLANMFVLGHAFPVFAPWLFMIGIPLALLFKMPFKELSKNIAMEIIPFILGVIGAGTDIVSYIRLFAVGLATVAVADAANYMPEALPAFGVGYLFLIILHSLNMVLAIMAILVHAIRLNVLEFSGHLGLEWAGFKYSPFEKKLKQD